MSLLSDIERLLAPLRHKIATAILKGVLETLKDTTDLQIAKVTVEGEPLNDLERIQQYGFTSFPESGAETVVLSVNGNKDQSFIIAIDDHRYRLKVLSSGDVALYSKGGNYILLKANGDIQVHSDTITLGDGSSFKKLITEDILSVLSGHTHLFPASAPSAPTSPPTYIPPLSTALHATSKTKAE